MHNDRAGFRALNLPAAFVEFAHSAGPAGTIFGAHPVDVLGEVADLVEGVPDRELKIALRRTGGQDDLHFNQMLFG